jgi:replicative DNA helicase
MAKKLYDTNIGKVQPQSVDTEKHLIGSIILYQESYDLVSALLRPEHFYNEQHGMIYKACQNLIINAKPIDYLTIATELKRVGEYELVGGGYYIMSLTNDVSTAANIETHAAIIVEKYLLRETIRLGTQMIQKAYEDSTDCFDLIDWSGTEINNMLNVIEIKQAKKIEQLSSEVLEDCFKSLSEDKPTGVPISLHALQKQTNGWRKGNLIILAARPAMGKTAVALDYAYHPAKNGTPVGFFSLEMTGKELAGRLMSKESGISSQKINNNLVDTYELTALRKDCLTFKDLPLYIDDTPALSIQRLRSKALRMKREFGIQMIIIDYLQLMDGSNDKDNREQEISKISRGLKKLSKELDIPIIALSQLSRIVESRPSKKPQLSDLRDSGAIEQDADIVIFLLRPEYYEIERYLYGNEEIDTSGLMIHIIAKFRGGVTGEVRNRWIGETTSIADWNTDIPIVMNDLPPLQNNSNFLDDII